MPIFYLLSRKKNLSIYKIFNNQKYIILFVSFVIFHYFFTNILYHQIIEPYELLNLFFLIILSFIYCHYRNFLSNNFESILFLYLIIFIGFSFYEQKGDLILTLIERASLCLLGHLFHKHFFEEIYNQQRVSS